MTVDNPATTGDRPTVGAPSRPAAEELRPIPAPHSQKFRVALAVLVGIALGALAIAVAIIARGGNRNTAVASGHWSSWSPTDRGDQGVAEIAAHIAPFYRLGPAQQLNVVTPIQVTQATAAGTTTGSGMTVAIQPSASPSSTSSLSLLNGKTVAYNICGLGTSKCQLPGTPTTSRMLLMRREALELALYTFKYISGSENVLTVLPPGKSVKPTTTHGARSRVTVAVLFIRRELQPFLNVPLGKTLQAYPPDVPELSLWSKTQEAGLVDQVTANGLFSSQVKSLQVGGNVLVLSPLPPQ
ncbi:MAG: hypothetical protein FWD04_09640 [Conexibacteraceae bacterium]|nr:hypothetical protein [Conexibacteraceae bacterium]